MRAALWNGEFELEIAEVIVREPDDHEVVIDLTAVVTCITDVMGMKSPPFPGAPPLPHILGHGGVGIVSAIGRDVTRVGVGDLVLAAANPWCGVCYACVRDRPDQCGALAFEGPPLMTADGRSATPHSYLGSYAEQAITRDIQVVGLDTDASHEALAILADGGAGGLGGAFNVAPLPPGAIVGVVGCGQTGLAYIQAARFLGAEQIIAIDPLAHRRALAERFGATTTLDASDPDLVENVKNLAGSYPARYGDKRGVEFAFEAAGDERAMGIAFQITRPTGHVVLAGLPKDPLAGVLALPALEAAMTGKAIHGCQWGETALLRDIPRWAGLIEQGAIDFDTLVSTRFDLPDINDATARIDHYDVAAAVLTPGRSASAEGAGERSVSAA